MATKQQTLADKLRALTPEHVRSVEDYVSYLLDRQRRAELEAQAVANGWPPGYFENVIGSMPDFPDVDGDMSGLDPSLDETDEELSFDADADERAP